MRIKERFQQRHYQTERNHDNLYYTGREEGLGVIEEVEISCLVRQNTPKLIDKRLKSSH
jgi:hypothetical protein